MQPDLTMSVIQYVLSSQRLYKMYHIQSKLGPEEAQKCELTREQEVVNSLTAKNKEFLKISTQYKIRQVVDSQACRDKMDRMLFINAAFFAGHVTGIAMFRKFCFPVTSLVGHGCLLWYSSYERYFTELHREGLLTTLYSDSLMQCYLFSILYKLQGRLADVEDFESIEPTESRLLQG